jgi:excisionase family DNA binding protein
VSRHGAERLWTVDEVADYLRASPRTVHRRIADGTIPVVRIGGLLRFRPDAVAAALSTASLPLRESAILAAIRDEFDATEVERSDG